MDKTTTWLVRAASIFIIILGFGYIKNPLENKLKQLTSSYKESQTISNIVGIACANSEKLLNKSDDDIVTRKVHVWHTLFDLRNGELYNYDRESNSIYKHLNYQLIRSKEDGDIYAYIGYLKDSSLYTDETLLVEGEQTERRPIFKINLKTLKFIVLFEVDQKYLLTYKCRYIQLPKIKKIVSAEKIYFEDD